MLDMFGRYTAFCLFLLSSLALAQDVPVIVLPQDEPPETGYYVGGGLGLFYVAPTVYGHLGYKFAEDADVRVSLEGTPLLFGLRLAADYLYRPNLFYLGGGFRVWYVPTLDIYRTTDFDFSLAALGGFTIPGEVLDYFAELELTYAAVGDIGVIPIVALRVGLSYPL